LPNLGALFYRLAHAPSRITAEEMDEIERFVILLYSRTLQLSKVDEALKQASTCLHLEVTS